MRVSLLAALLALSGCCISPGPCPVPPEPIVEPCPACECQCPQCDCDYLDWDVPHCREIDPGLWVCGNGA